jgi:hypothetical protein
MGNVWFNSICWAARGAEGVVIALDFSSTRWATFFALFLFCFFYYKSGWTLPATLYRGLPCSCPWYIRSCLLFLPSVNSMPLITSKRARVLALHLALPGRWPAPALGMRHSRAGTAVAQALRLRSATLRFFALDTAIFLPPTLRRRGSAQGVSAAGSLPPLLALDWPSCWPFGQAPACPFECARVVVFYNYFERSWFC